MIHIEKNQPLADDQTLRVAVPTGDYNETDLIECYPKGGDSSEPTLMCQALYVVYGGAIYHQSEEITKDQVDALKAGRPIGEVINNKSLIDNKEPAAKYIGRIIKTTGPVGPQLLRTDSIVPEEVTEETDIETPTTVPPLDVTPSTTTPITNVSTTTAATTTPRRPRFNKTNAPDSTSNSSNSTTTPFTSTTTTDVDAVTEPVVNPVGTEPVTNADLEAVTDTVLDTVEAVIAPEVSNSAPTRQLVSYAKKKIKKRLTQ